MQNESLLNKLKKAALRADLEEIRQLIYWDEAGILDSYEDIIVANISDIIKGVNYQISADQQKIYNEIFPIMKQQFVGAKSQSRLSLTEQVNFIKSVMRNQYAIDTDLFSLFISAVSTKVYEEPTQRQEFLDFILISKHILAFQLLLKAEPRFGLFLINRFQYGEYQKIKKTPFFREAYITAQILNDSRMLQEELKPIAGDIGNDKKDRKQHKI